MTYELKRALERMAEVGLAGLTGAEAQLLTQQIREGINLQCAIDSDREHYRRCAELGYASAIFRTRDGLEAYVSNLPAGYLNQGGYPKRIIQRQELTARKDRMQGLASESYCPLTRVVRTYELEKYVPYNDRQVPLYIEQPA